MKKMKKFSTFIVLLLCMSFIFIGCDQSIQNNEEDESTATASEKEAFVGAVEDFVETKDMNCFTDDTPIMMPDETAMMEVADLDYEELFDNLFPMVLSDQLDDDFEYTFKDEEGEDTIYTFEMDSFEIDDFEEYIEFLTNDEDEDEENDHPLGYYIGSEINPTLSMSFTIKKGSDSVISASAQLDVEMTSVANESGDESESPYIYSLKLNELKCSATLFPNSSTEMKFAIEIFETEIITEESLGNTFEQLDLSSIESASDLRDLIDEFTDAVWVDNNPLTVSITANTADGKIIYEFDFDEILDISLDCWESISDIE
ncbi:MAG: hypothetical protein ACRQFF_08895 [Sphaerochaeta sp.]